MGINQSTFDPDTKTVTSVPSLLDDSGDSVLLVNNDPNNTIYIGGDVGVTPSQRINASIPPLGSIALDGSDGPIFGVCSVGQTAVCQIIPKGVTYAPSPVLIAQQVLNSGVVVVDNPKNLITGAQTFPPVTNQIYGPFTVNTFQSWNFNFTATGVAPTTPYIAMRFYWTSDVAGVNYTHIEDWVLSTDPNAYATFYGHGPMRGPYMWVEFNNYDTIANAHATVSLVASGRSVNESSIRSWSVQAPPGLGSDDVLAWQDLANLAPNASSSVIPVGLYNGPVSIRLGAYAAGIAVNSVSLFLRFQPVSDFSNNATYIITGPSAAAGTNSPELDVTLNFPKRVATMQITNDSSTVTVTSIRARIIAKGTVQ